VRIDDYKYRFTDQPNGWLGATEKADWPYIIDLRLDPSERTGMPDGKGGSLTSWNRPSGGALRGASPSFDKAYLDPCSSITRGEVMTTNWKNRLPLAIVAVLAVAVVVLAFTTRPALGRAEEGRAASPHYSVVLTEGHNLLVTDNGANKIYFYTIDKDKPIGSPLKLRASMDLTKVGQDVIEITNHNVEK
jgi:hypothetical protein